MTRKQLHDIGYYIVRSLRRPGVIIVTYRGKVLGETTGFNKGRDIALDHYRKNS